jgi:hypothetical protein
MSRDVFQRTIRIQRLEEQAGISDHFRKMLAIACKETGFDEDGLLEAVGIRLLLTKPESFEAVSGRVRLVMFRHQEKGRDFDFTVFFSFDRTLKSSSRRFNLLGIGLGQPSTDVMQRYRKFAS